MEKQSFRAAEFCELARRAELALLDLANATREAGPEILRNGSAGQIREALANGRGIRAPYTSYMQAFAAFDEKASYKLRDYEAALAARNQAQADTPPTPAAVKEATKKGTPKYEALRALPGWPCLIDPEAAAQAFGIANDIYFLDQPSWPAWGSFDHKAAFLMRGKFEKWAKRTASALRHLCIMLSEFQRPGDPSHSGRASKQAIAQLIKDQAKEWRQLERQVIDAIMEAADTR